MSDDAWAYALNPANIAGCPYCDDHGQLWQGMEVAGRCSHQPEMSDLTVADILEGRWPSDLA